MGLRSKLDAILSFLQKVNRPRGQSVTTASEVNRLLKRGAPVLFVDVRSLQEYLERHIPKSVSIPLETLEERFGEVPTDRLVVLYCATPHYVSSLAYRKLYTKGFRNLQVLDEGIRDWIKQGYPTEGTSAETDRPKEKDS